MPQQSLWTESLIRESGSKASLELKALKFLDVERKRQICVLFGILKMQKTTDRPIYWCVATELDRGVSAKVKVGTV